MSDSSETKLLTIFGVLGIDRAFTPKAFGGGRGDMSPRPNAVPCHRSPNSDQAGVGTWAGDLPRASLMRARFFITFGGTHRIAPGLLPLVQVNLNSLEGRKDSFNMIILIKHDVYRLPSQNQVLVTHFT